MEIAEAQGILKRNFEEVAAEGKILRCKNKYSIHFFDFSQALLSDTFDVDKYQADAVIKDYYENNSELQWNFYLHFVVADEKFGAIRSSSLAHRVERNKTYTRKEIISEKQFKTSFNAVTGQTQPLTNDYDRIADRWIGKLRAANLDCVYTPGKEVSPSVREYVVGNFFKEDVEGREEHHDESANMTRVAAISDLNITKFRSFPPAGNYTFGSVNLIVGPNGTGKTSLLEAIEIALCGQNFRGEAKIDGIDIEIGFKGLTRRDKIGGKNTLYRARDQKWYGRNYPTGNYLSYSFNRFNFHDADAPFRLSHPLTGNKKSEITLYDSFLKIALGEQVNVIADRSERFLTEFSGKESDLTREVNSLEAELKNQDDLKNTKVSTGHENLAIEMVAEPIRKLGMDNQNAEDLDALLARVGNASVTVNQINETCRWLSKITFDLLTKEGTRLEKAVNDLKVLASQERDLEKKMLVLQSDSKEKSRMKDLLERAMRYYSEPEISNIHSLNEDLQKRKATIDNLKILADQLRQLSSSSNTPVEKSTEDLLAEERRLNAETEKELSETIQEVGKLRKVTSEIENIVSQIHTLGKELAKLDDAPDDCPLCQSTFKTGDLRLRITTVKKDSTKATKDVLKLRAALDRQTDLSKRKADGDDRIKQINSAQNLAAELSTPSMSLTKQPISVLLQRISSAIPAAESTIANLEVIKADFKRKNLDAGEFSKILTSLEARYSDAPKGTINEPFLRQKLNECSAQEFEILKELDKFTKERDLIYVKIQSLTLDNLGESVTGVDAERELSWRRDTAQKAISDLTALSVNLKNVRSLDMKQVSLELSKMESLITKLKIQKEESTRVSQILKQAEDRIRQLQDDLSKKREMLKLASQAIECLNEILQVDSKEKALQAFISANSDEIAKTFGKIHTPREFTSLAINGTDIVLTRGSTAKSCSIGEISTGQRAALAMSIFLTLNKHLTEAPPIIMIDDPIAQVDDLNLLSFLDHLRELVASGSRQLFFSTANQKIANFFKKKFWFLGEEFKEFNLSRG